MNFFKTQLPLGLWKPGQEALLYPEGRTDSCEASLSASKASGGEIGGAGESPHYREASSTPKSLVTHEFLLTYLTHCHLTQEMGFLSDSSGQNQVDEVTRRRNQINKKKDP